MKTENLQGKQVKFAYVAKERLDEFLKLDTERVEMFMDDTGKLYIVSKGDLDTYFLRNGTKTKPKEENEFLKGVSFDLF